MNQVYTLIFLLFLSVKTEAFEIDLQTPYTAHETCTFYKYDSIPLDFASAAISKCYTRNGKIDLFAYTFLGLAIGEAFESLGEDSEPTSKMHEIISEYVKDSVDFEKSIISLNDRELESLILKLFELGNKYRSPKVREKRKLSSVIYSKESAIGTDISVSQKESPKYEFSFRKTSNGWLVHGMKNVE